MDMKHKIIAVIICLLMCGNVYALSTGAKVPTSSSTASSDPHSDNDWVTIAEIYSNNGTHANITDNTYDNGDQSYLAYVKGFDFSALPTDAVITGVTLEFEAYYAVGGSSIDYLYLLDASGAVQGNNNCATPYALSATAGTTFTRGSSSDTWGATLTRAIVTDADFGICLGTIATGNNSDIYFDYVTMTIEYTSASTATGQVIICD
jgi:hypothetical protein